ncbi:MAG: type II toxin-antitoxin system VapC family toxin [Rhodoglobus sp.]
MVIDSSALVAFATKEPQARAINDAIADASLRRVAAPTWFETSMVLRSARFSLGPSEIDGLRDSLGLQVSAFTAEHADVARDAWERFGKGRHPARLNFGDCIAYAVAKVAGEPLLYVGDDFTKTDIESAL